MGWTLVFNTNETHAPGAYKRMFERGVAAIYGYADGPANLEGAAANDKVLRAIGMVLDPQVRGGSGIFIDDDGKQLPDEYHLKVRWDVVSPEKAISAADVANQLGYSLPVRSVFAKLHRGSVALRLQQELRSRAEASKSG